LIVCLLGLAGRHVCRAAEPAGSGAGPTAEQQARAEDRLLFTPPGFDRPGQPKTASGDNVARLQIVIRDAATRQPTPCRINVVGPDGNYYQPPLDRLSRFAFTGQWPERGKGNRRGKGPFRYYGRFFYSAGRTRLAVPAGPIRVEVWKGFEYRPAVRQRTVAAGETVRIEIDLQHTLDMPARGWYAGDPHLHFTRATTRDEDTILDLLDAEGIRYGTLLAYNEPAGPYHGRMKAMDMPQYRGLGQASIRRRGAVTILSGQEYRSTTYGHLNLFFRDHLVLAGRDLNADNGPIYGKLARETRAAGGFAFYAHGGYAQAVYADFIQQAIDGVELLQHGIYRGIGLDDWYHMLNVGVRLPATGACDYPACRKLGDAKTYVYCRQTPTFRQWFAAASAGRSFFTTGPMLELTVDGQQPGATVARRGHESHRAVCRVRVASEVAPVTELQLIVNGHVAKQQTIPAAAARGYTYQWDVSVELADSSWIAARAFSRSPLGKPDADAHTNPVYVLFDRRPPYVRQSLDVLVERIDAQMAHHKQRDFAEKVEVLAYFQRSRDILLKIRELGGIPANRSVADVAALLGPELARPGARSHSETALREFLRPIPARPIEEALRSFEVADGFEMQLVAREPLVVDPVAAAFDQWGNLYVCEMRDYPFAPRPGHDPRGTVRILRDTDGDGTFDTSHVFADKLLWACGVTPWKGGVFVTAPPDIWYLRDTDGDDSADVRRKVFTGFGTQNQQAMLNNLKFGLDHKIYGSTAYNGGTVRHADRPNEPPISVDGKDFRFDPASEQFESISGTVQFGTSFDRWGNRFLCSQASPLKQAILPQRYLARNPFLPVPNAIHDIAGSSIPIYRISPVERWRQIRSSRRIAHRMLSANSAGASQHVVDAAAGVTIYRGGAYPADFLGQMFVGDAQNNVVHRRILSPAGVTFTSRRADDKTEFIRSSDNWFRPVNFVHAPDGTLYLLDMSRQIIESIHIPLDVVKFLDLTSGRDKGRIYRIAPPGFQAGPVATFGHASPRDLVAALESPHAWRRETAHRLIYERQDRAAVDPLRQLLHGSGKPAARLLALWSLEGLGALTDHDLLAAMSDDAAPLREHAVRLSESRLHTSTSLLERAVALADDANARVRLQVAFSLGEAGGERATPGLARIARRDAAGPWMRTAVLSSSVQTSATLFAELAKTPSFLDRQEGAALLESLAVVVGARHDAGEMARLFGLLAVDTRFRDRPVLARTMLLAVARGRRQTGGLLTLRDAQSEPTRKWLGAAWSRAAEVIGKRGAPLAARKQAIAIISAFADTRAIDLLAGLIDPQESDTIQIAAVRGLAGFDDPTIEPRLLDRWRRYTPLVRAEVVRVMLARERWTRGLLRAALSGAVDLSQLALADRARLRTHRSRAVRDLAERLFGKTPAAPRRAVVATYRASLTLSGDRKRGHARYRENCMACHQIGNEGHPVGPDLLSTAAADAEALMTNIIDPNHYVAPNYAQYVLIDTRGRSHHGIIAAQTATSITLRREQGETETLLRTQIDELAATGKSLMPEGFERKLDPQGMADLIAFLTAARRTAQAAGNVVEPPLAIGTLPGMIEPDGKKN